MTLMLPKSNCLLLGAAMAAALTGCCEGHGLFGFDHCAVSPPGAVPAPVGTYSCQWQTAQATRAEADDFVIYRYEWLKDSAELSPFGSRHLFNIAPRVIEMPFPVLIEPSGLPELDQLRLETIIERLAALHVPNPHERVKIGFAEAEPLYGIEARNVERGYIGRGSQGGQASGLGGGFQGGGQSGFIGR